MIGAKGLSARGLRGAIQTAKRSVTRVIDQADDQNPLAPYGRLEKPDNDR